MAAMKQAKAYVLTINGGPSSTRFALFEANDRTEIINLRRS
jgi:acetate kinase